MAGGATEIVASAGSEGEGDVSAPDGADGSDVLAAGRKKAKKSKKSGAGVMPEV